LQPARVAFTWPGGALALTTAFIGHPLLDLKAWGFLAFLTRKPSGRS
jgi:hypothetical protein